MGGHERSLKTCLWGMTCLLPDYAVLCVCAVGGLGRMSREHMAVAVALESERRECGSRVVKGAFQ
jgi:GTPase